MKVKITMEIKNIFSRGIKEVELETETIEEMEILLDHVKEHGVKME